MKKKFAGAIAVFLSLCLAVPPSYAANIYVDQMLSSDCTSGNYSTVNRACNGSDGNAYNTIQDVIWGTNGTNGAANVGDVILLRGGTYLESWGTVMNGDYGASMVFPSRLNGTAWSAGNYTTIASYPGEWAILDGQNSNHYAVLGNGTLSSGTGGERAYWKIERLEVKNGSSAGIGIIVGPIWIRYCYIHNNGNGTYGDQNRSGINLRRGMGAIVEYNYFYDNGGDSSNDNGTHIDNYADYYYDDYPGPTTNYPSCNRDNVIKYNLFVGVNYARNYAAYKDKATQYLQNYRQDGHAANTTYNTHGNKIHHNIAAGSHRIAFQLDQDFEQLYNNIVDGSSIGSQYGSTVRPSFYNSVYNNTVIGGFIATHIGRDRPETVLDMGWFAVNNINSNSSNYDTSGIISIAPGWRYNSCNTYRVAYDWTNTVVDRNLIYQPQLEPSRELQAQINIR